MKTQKAEIVQALRRLAETVEMRKELDKVEKAIKDQIKEFMGDEMILHGGDYVAIQKEVKRTDLDKQALQAHLGDDYENFLKQTSYRTLEVKKEKL